MSTTLGVEEGGQDEKGTIASEVYVKRGRGKSKVVRQKKPVQLKIRN
jgi:hypothetical protein